MPRLTLDPSREVKLTITTAAGSKFLDRKVEIKVPLRTTVEELKGIIEVRALGMAPGRQAGRQPFLPLYGS